MRSNILVTGAGAVLGQGILRCLREFKNNYRIHTADPDIKSTGHWLGDKAHTILYANDTNYISSVEKIITAEGIDVILIGTDTELPVFAKQKDYLEDRYKLKVVVSNESVIQIANDKLLTSEFLKKNNFPHPFSFMSADIDGMNFLKDLGRYPYFAKPVDGARSKGIMLIKSESDLEYVASFSNNLVVQEYIGDEEGEFTAGCLTFNNVCSGVVILKRDLRDGNTYRAYYNKSFEKFKPFLMSVAEKLKSFGPCNFQFRIRNGEPVIFEINSRFSGTTPIRNYFGFNEVKATLDYILENKPVPEVNLKSGIVMRAWADIFVSEDEMNKFKDAETLDSPQCFYHPFKN